MARAERKCLTTSEAQRKQNLSMAKIPDASNFFSSLDTTLSKRHIARLYGALGWQVRKCTWVDYEVTSDWAELVIESERPILMHGSVADLLARAEELVAPLRVAKVSFSAECYATSPERELLLELHE